MKSTPTAVLFILVIFSLMISSTGCDVKSFFAPPWQEEAPDEPAPDKDAISDAVQPEPEQDPPAPIFYNQLTGLVCDEEFSSDRPISVCIGNFDGKRQEGLSFADIIAEAPVDGGTTRMWAMYGAPSAAQKITPVRSAREYMMPIVRSFGSIAAYAGTTDTAGASNTLFTGDTLDYVHHNLTSTFVQAEEGLSVSGSALIQAASGMGYATESQVKLPYTLTAPDKPLQSVGNSISSVSFSFFEGKTVSFSYQKDTKLYTRSQNGAAHVDDATKEQLAFSNVILLFHNVNYYHSADGTSFALDTAAGGNGFYYTAGGVTSLKWQTDANGEISFYDPSGNSLSVNRGKTYIAMLRVTDSTSVIAK